MLLSCFIAFSFFFHSYLQTKYIIVINTITENINCIFSFNVVFLILNLIFKTIFAIMKS
nr:MAG TPA: hypothetical protein [Caudoviricetes sp.]DAX92838.1 MAG TPA: hypothetical protein [Caudoviricetes sp.]